MLCSKCGREFADGTKFCGICETKDEPVEANRMILIQENLTRINSEFSYCSRGVGRAFYDICA